MNYAAARLAEPESPKIRTDIPARCKLRAGLVIDGALTGQDAFGRFAINGGDGGPHAQWGANAVWRPSPGFPVRGSGFPTSESGVIRSFSRFSAIWIGSGGLL